MNPTQDIIQEARNLISYNSIKELNELVFSLDFSKINIPFVYKNLFLFACKHSTEDIIIWFVQLYFELETVERIGLRQLFKYGKTIMKKNSFINMNWFHSFVEALF